MKVVTLDHGLGNKPATILMPNQGFYYDDSRLNLFGKDALIKEVSELARDIEYEDLLEYFKDINDPDVSTAYYISKSNVRKEPCDCINNMALLQDGELQIEYNNSKFYVNGKKEELQQIKEYFEMGKDSAKKAVIYLLNEKSHNHNSIN